MSRLVAGIAVFVALCVVLVVLVGRSSVETPRAAAAAAASERTVAESDAVRVQAALRELDRALDALDGFCSSAARDRLTDARARVAELLHIPGPATATR